MTHFARAILGLLALSVASTALAAEVELRPKYRPGDTYALSIRAKTDTVADSRSGENDGFEEKVDLHYRATVEVLAVDGDGRPLRERHRGARLTFERPDDSGSMFRGGTTFEVRRGEDGRASMFVQGQPVDPRIQKPVVDLLDTQFEYSLGPVLLDPGRRVALGESWQLDRSLSRRYLRDQGVRVMKLGAPGTATLREADGAEDAAYVIEYSIPVEWFVLDRMPPGARASETTARFEGEIRLPATPGASIAHTSRLELAMDGIAGDVGAAHIVTWHVKSLKISSQRSVRVESLSRRGADGAPISRSDPRTHLADRWTPGAR